jgi:hypothetical protein
MMIDESPAKILVLVERQQKQFMMSDCISITFFCFQGHAFITLVNGPVVTNQMNSTIGNYPMKTILLLSSRLTMRVTVIFTITL